MTRDPFNDPPKNPPAASSSAEAPVPVKKAPKKSHWRRKKTAESTKFTPETEGSVLADKDTPSIASTTSAADEKLTNPITATAPSTLDEKPVDKKPVKPKKEKQSKARVQLPINPVVDQPVDDLYVMIRAQRQEAPPSPTITIYTGTDQVTGIYKRLAMACSSILNTHFTAHPPSLEYTISDAVDAAAINYLLVTWPRSMVNDFEVHAISLQETFAQNISLLRASRLLNMEAYTKWILNTHVAYLRNSLPSYAEIAAVEAAKSSEKDPLWTHMVNHLCHMRYRQQMPDAEDFAAFLEEHTELKSAMETTDAYFAGEALKKWEAGNEERRARWERNEKERRERWAREKEAAESLMRKMEGKSSGLLMVTEDEAMILGRNR